MDTPELARHEAAAERCKMERWAVDLTRDAVRVVTTTGREIGTFLTPEDAIAVCWLHEQQAALVAALTDAVKARTDAVIAMEEAENRRAAAEHEHEVYRIGQQRYAENAAREVNALKAGIDVRQTRCAAAEAEANAMRPLVEAVGKWARDRHSPNLLAAWDRFTKERP